MGNELEATYLEINKDELREKLKFVKAELIKPETQMKRVVFDTGVGTFARVRDEGDKIVMTYKRVFDDSTISGTKEVNVVVDNYENALMFLDACGLVRKAEQVTYREIWELDGAEICIDTWPWIPTYVEIEAPTAEQVWSVSEKLGFNKDDAFFGSVDRVYNHYYGVEKEAVNSETPVINFEVEPPKWVK